MSANWEVQQAIYTALSSNSTLMNLIGNRLYDEPNGNEVYPYVVLGNAIQVTDNRLNKKGYEISFQLNIYTKRGTEGFYQAKKIEEQINSTLNQNTTMTMTNFDLVGCLLNSSRTSREDDKRIIDIDYRIIVSEKTDG